MNDLQNILPNLNAELLLIIGIVFGILTTASTLFFIVGRICPTANLSELKARTKSWWIMASIFILSIVLNAKISFLAIAFLSFVAFRELYSLIDLRQSDRSALLVALLAIPVQYYLAFIGWYAAFIILIPVVLFLLLPMQLVFKGDTEGFVYSMSSIQWSLMLTVYGISHMAYLLSLPTIEGFESGGRGLLFFLVFLTEFNDVLQFIWGKLFGKHPITPNISPYKTWEGFLGGLFSTILIGYLIAFLTPFNTWQVLLVSFLIAIAGFIGDLVVSGIKRDVGVKDTGSAIPGHGGFLDRIDSLAYSAPVFFHLVLFLVY